MGNKKVEITIGKKYGNLVVLEESHKTKQGHIQYSCLCDCGNIINTTGSRLVSNYVLSCGCLRKDNAKKMGKNRQGKSLLEKGEAGIYKLYNQYKNGAKKRNIEFLLTKEDIKELSSKNCKYCGVPPSQVIVKESIHGKYIYNGIDRVNNKLGYIKENCVPCCKQCNRSKSDLTEEQFYNWVEKIFRSRYDT